MAVKFFNPADVFGLTAKGWSVQNNNPTTTQDRAQWLKADGDEGGKKLHNARTNASATYTATKADADIPKFGEILNGWHCDNVTLAYTNTGFAQITVTGHKHGSSAHPACRVYAGTITKIGAQFGCPTPVSCTVPTGAGVRSINYVLTGNHLDELDSEGEFLGAQNHDGNETETVELCDDGVIAAKSGWDATSVGNAEGNTQAATASGTFVKHIAGADPAAA